MPLGLGSKEPSANLASWQLPDVCVGASEKPALHLALERIANDQAACHITPVMLHDRPIEQLQLLVSLPILPQLDLQHKDASISLQDPIRLALMPPLIIQVVDPGIQCQRPGLADLPQHPVLVPLPQLLFPRTRLRGWPLRCRRGPDSPAH